MLVAGARCLCPATEHDDVGARDVHGVTETVLRRSATHAQSCPNVRLSVQHSDVVKVALLQGSALVVSSSSLHVFLVEPETAMDDQV